MPIPSTSAQAQATASQVFPYQNTQYDNKPSKNIKTLTIIRKISESNQEHKPCSLFLTDTKISLVGGKAFIENCSNSGAQFIGKGGFGTVSKGLLQDENGLQSKVAVKTISSECYYEKYFYNEVNALRILENQDHVVQFCFALLSTSDLNGHIIMECGDINLQEYIQFIKKHPEISINYKQLAKIGHDTFSGMLACLKFNILNLDIKPSNYVMFFSQGIIKMIDFGVLSRKKNLDDKILNTMITQTTDSFLQCTFNKANSDNQETQDNLQAISFNSANNSPISDEDKAYFKQHIPPYVNGNPLLLKLAQGVFSGDSNLLDITKTIEDIKELELQAPTDIRDML